MPIAVERHPDLPVLLFRYSGAITLDNMIESYMQSLHLLSSDDGLMYRIVQVENLESNFAEVLKLAQSSASAAPETPSASHRQLPPVVVGHDKWTKLYIQLMSQRQFGSMSIPCFLTIDQALDYIRDQLQREAS